MPNYFCKKHCNLAKEYSVGDTLVFQDRQFAIIQKFITPSIILLDRNISTNDTIRPYALSSQNGTIKWKFDEKWPELTVEKSEEHSVVNLLSKYPVMHFVKVGDKIAFGQTILNVTGF